MKAFLGYVAGVLLALTTSPAWAQLELPPASPAAKVMQVVGLTEISVDYSSPAVKGRQIWGGLVPWEQVWRTGANAATKITFGRDVTFGGKPVPAGTYALVTIPSEKGWTVVLNKELRLYGGGKSYDAKDDVVRVSGAASEIPNRERLAFLFSNTTDDQTSLDMEWEKLRISVPIQANTAAQAQENIQAMVNGSWRSLANAGRYVADTSKDYPTALKYLDSSLAIQSHWYNNWFKADILARSGKYAEARKLAQTAWDMGQKDPNFFVKDAVAKALVDWKGKK
ncbi:DUF2911 domain-containing protein [Stigmatella sp. ncwal1]|uniref:DUF2911 domain-containing protein n=1 Tax=Stigmatella ashevillensis TaxID=2995309 RepID=A0ABT5DKN7_9BACT|nr:DUF2911 domain-containing protein [Stigmatella ashevillena]MDC0713690.1 DUF2911 domain-containing protein [Stigmatella ashevillena]